MNELIFYILSALFIFYIFNNIIIPFSKQVKKLQKIKLICFDMFDNNKACPEIIPDCQKLREEFFLEKEKVKLHGACIKCVDKHIKRKYINLVASLIHHKL